MVKCANDQIWNQIAILCSAEAINLSTIAENGPEAGELGNFSRKENPFSQAYIIFGSIGTLPK